MTGNEKNERFLRLLEPIHDNLVRFARSIVRNDEDARDLVAATILRALEKFDTLRDDRAFLSWIFTITLRLNHAPRRYRDRFTPDLPESADRQQSRTPPPDLGYDIELLRSSIERLPAREREAILLFELGGLPIEEIRQVQGGTLSGVKSRLMRGRRKLGWMMGEARSGPPRGKKASGREHPSGPEEKREEVVIYATRIS